MKERLRREAVREATSGLTKFWFPLVALKCVLVKPKTPHFLRNGVYRPGKTHFT